MIKSKKSRDLDLANQLHEEINCFGVTENAILPRKGGQENYKPRTLIDHTLELIDPTPNIFTLFVQFNERFFSNILLPVEVKWSNRMTSCAGVCTFHPRSRECVITLSAPLLKLRPRKDLVETLLHEMIHGFLFLTNNNRDRDGHGPEFCKHMNRINNAAGTNITIYHSFHNEVKLYQQHWWRCNGPCQKRAPYFGTVRRSMNRAPGPSDFWWKEHKQSCNGEFIKIKEPENFKSRGPRQKSGAKPVKKTPIENNISNWITKSTPSITVPKSTSTPKQSKPIQNIQNSLNGLKKLGTNTNNVYGWGTSGPNGNAANNSPSTGTSIPSIPTFSCAGTLGGIKTGQSNLLKKFGSNSGGLLLSTPTASNKIQKNTTETWTKKIPSNALIKKVETPKESNVHSVACPICNESVHSLKINEHIDSCLQRETEEKTKPKSAVNSNSSNRPQVNLLTPPEKRKKSSNVLPNKQPKLDFSESPSKTNCPICSKRIPHKDINNHLDECLLKSSDPDTSSPIKISDSELDLCHTPKAESVISISSTSSSDSPSSPPKISKTGYVISDSDADRGIKNNAPKCLICDAVLTSGMSLSDHLEDCIGTVFNDESTLSMISDDNDESEECTPQDDKYPCPVCMELISQNCMNQHLDSCLQK